MQRVFVYGTLRAGGAANELLLGCGPHGPASLRGTLYDVRGRYPALVLEGADEVHGEVWECPAWVLARLDQYEGVAEGLYRRVEVKIGGQPCWVYVAGPALLPRLRPGWRVPNGTWQPPEPGGHGGLR